MKAAAKHWATHQAALLAQGIGEVLLDEPMARHTTWRIGGPAALWIRPTGRHQLQKALAYLDQAELTPVIMGGGSNILVADAGLPHCVIQIGRGLSDYTVHGESIVAEAGIPLPFLAVQAEQHRLAGLTFAAGIPGSLGGAVVMNAGAYQSDMSAIVSAVDCLDRSGTLHHLTKEELDFSYRHSGFKDKRDLVIIQVYLTLAKGRSEEIAAAMAANRASRKEKQPLGYPNAGSVFQNPPGDAAARLLEATGCKGLRVGGAMISEKHSNFIINTGQASADDVLTLMAMAEKRVFDQFGVTLVREVRYLS